MLPFLISKTELLSLRKSKKTTDKTKDKTILLSGDGLKASIRLRRRPYVPQIDSRPQCDCALRHLTKIVLNYKPKTCKRGASNIVLSMTAWGTTGLKKRIKLPSVQLQRKVVRQEKPMSYSSDEFFMKLENQLKALNLGKPGKGKNKTASDTAGSQNSKEDILKTKKKGKGKDDKEELEKDIAGEVNVEIDVDDLDSNDNYARRRGKRRRRGRNVGSDRLTSAGLVAQVQQDPETQVGIGTCEDSRAPSSLTSVIPPPEVGDRDVIQSRTRKNAPKDSFIDQNILKFLHRDVDEDAIETEFDPKRRFVLKEALRTRPDRPRCQEVKDLMRDMKGPTALDDWLHVPRVFYRQSAQFSLPLDIRTLETLTPMQYATNFVQPSKSKQLLYLTVLRKYKPGSYKMPIKDVEEGLTLMMGGLLSPPQCDQFRSIMDWDDYTDEDISDEIKFEVDYSIKNLNGAGDMIETEYKVMSFKAWCGLCAICERMYGRFHPRDTDPPDGVELGDFSMLETKLGYLNIDKRLTDILHAIRIR